MNHTTLTEPATTAPRSLVFPALIIALFMSLFVLEITDSIVFHHNMARSTYFFPPAALLLWGVLTRRRWAWHASRIAMLAGMFIFGATGVAAMWFFPAIKARDQRGIVIVSLILVTLLALAFRALGKADTRRLFQTGATHE